MGACARGGELRLWLQGAALTVLVMGALVAHANAQKSSATPLITIPEPPKTFPIIGNGAASDPAVPLVTAAAANDVSGVRGLLDARIIPDEVEAYGRTPLIYAAMNDNADIAQMLVSRGARLDLRDKLGKTALHWAAERDSLKVMRVLLQAGATVDVQNQQGVTPLMLASVNGHTDAVRLLLQYHADPRKNDYTGHDALSWAAKHATIVRALTVAANR